MSDHRVTRRVVTGHDADGTSVVLSDGPVPSHRELEDDGVAFSEVWQTDAMPAPVLPTEPDEPTLRTLTVPPGPDGTKIRINEFLPGHLDAHGRQSPVHRTESIDYGIVIDGEITLLLDDSEVVLRAGDVVVQRGTDHAWANRGTEAARVAFVLVDGRFTPDLLDLLPADVAASVMRHGPRGRTDGGSDR